MEIPTYVHTGIAVIHKHIEPYGGKKHTCCEASNLIPFDKLILMVSYRSQMMALWYKPD